MSQGETKAVETTGYKPMILCASQNSYDEKTPTHALRRLELRSLAFGENTDHVVTACTLKLGRPVAVFFAPADEIDCAACVAQVLGARKK